MVSIYSGSVSLLLYILLLSLLVYCILWYLLSTLYVVFLIFLLYFCFFCFSDVFFSLYLFFFFFKQKTAYEMRISDWSSDVCSSDLFEVPGPEIHRADGIPAGLEGGDLRLAVDRVAAADVVDRVEEEVDHQPDGVATVGRAEQRQHDVRAVAGAVGGQRLPEILIAVFQAEARGVVDEAEERRVGDEARDRDLRCLQVALEQVGCQDHRALQLVEEAAHHVAYRIRHRLLVQIGGRLQDERVEGLVDREHHPVGRLERIVDLPGLHVSLAGTTGEQPSRKHRRRE